MSSENEKTVCTIEGAFSAPTMWGTLGPLNLHFTDKRIIVGHLRRSGGFFGVKQIIGVVIAAVGWSLIRHGLIWVGVALIIVGGGICLSSFSRKTRVVNEKPETQKTPEEILASHSKNYAIDYDDVQKVILKCPLKTGRSDITIESRTGRLALEFKKEQFEDVSSSLPILLPGKVEVK